MLIPPEGPQPAAGSPPPKDFLAQKKPSADAERVACLAYYLTHYRGQQKFRTKDLTELNSKAAQPVFSIKVAADNATRHSKYLTQAGEGQKQLTARGEAVVKALPGREQVKAALREHPLRRRSRKRAAASAKSE